jgi:hypothetical protein
MAINFTNNFHSKALQNLPKLGFLVFKKNAVFSHKPQDIIQLFLNKFESDQSPSGMTMSVGRRQDACQPSSHLSQSKIHSGWSDVAHFLHANSMSSSSSSSSSLGVGDSAFLGRFGFLLGPLVAPGVDFMKPFRPKFTEVT